MEDTSQKNLSSVFKKKKKDLSLPQEKCTNYRLATNKKPP